MAAQALDVNLDTLQLMRWQTVVGGAGLVAVLLALIYNVRSANGAVEAANAASEANRISRDILSAENRPCVSLTVTPTNQTVIDGCVSFKVVFTNIGRTPTDGLYVAATFASPDTWGAKAVELHDEGIRRIRKMESEEGGIRENVNWYTALPDVPFVATNPAGREEGFDRIPIDDLRITAKVGKSGQLDTHIVACVLYGTDFDDPKDPTHLHKAIFDVPLVVIGEHVTVLGVYSVDPKRDRKRQ